MAETTTTTIPTRRALLRGGATAVMGVAALAGCTSEKAPDPEEQAAAAAGGPQKDKKVIFVVHGRNPFFTPVKVGYQQMAAMLGWEAQFMAPSTNSVQQTVKLQRNALSAKPDGLILSRSDPTAFDDNITRALDAGVKVVFSNVASKGYEKFDVGFVGQDFVAAGEVCGQEIAKRAAEHTGRTDGLIVCGNADPGNSALETRIQGIEQGVAAYNDANGASFTTETFVSSFDASEAVGLLDAKYTADGDNIVGFAMSANDHRFVATWSEQANLVGEFAVGGFDLEKPVLQGIKEGTIDFSLGQNPYAQGWVAAALLAMEIDPGFPASDYDTGAEVVDASNIEAIIKREERYL